ncbi:ABC transporter permease [Ornithinicoccus hortensis]|uniref:Transport permease protein n=1 Tax=Ornithinicoccus hortensis TaxID=82346 RepID=A0A542YUR2_9MICO|nr:ABC transporter permease [Ornithinicoccus hortensis]TQL51704.1 ABC-2 type transport system permease protein [Ornithinicoccus hortensis]
MSTTILTVAPAPGSGPLTASRVFVGRAVRHSLRDVEAMLMAVILPVMLMLMFTYVFGGAMAPSGAYADYLDYIVPGIVLTCAGFGAAATAVGVSQDLTTGTINRLRTMPLPSATVLVGHTVASLARNLLATAVVLLVAVAIGFRPDAGPAQWLGAVGLLAFYILAITAVFAMLGLVAHSPEAANGYGFVLLFLPYVSSAFVPVAGMPGWLQGFAGHQPITPVVEATRALLAGASPGSDALVAVAWCTGIVVLAVALTAYLFPRRVAR